jgi:hypothetical protein
MRMIKKLTGCIETNCSDSNITEKLQQWIVGYPDGSEYNFLFDGTKYCRMPIWSD